MKEFMNLQPQQWQEIYNYFITLPPLSSEETISRMAFRLAAYNFPEEVAQKVASYLYDQFTAHGFNPIYDDPLELRKDTYDPPAAYLSQQDLDYLENTILKSPDITLESLRLLLTYLIFARLNPHHSHWIKCDKKDKNTILYLASLSTLPVSQQESLIQLLHQKFSLNMRVVGSTQPIPCFQIPWQAAQPPVNEDFNPLFTIGPLAPKTIADFAATLIEKKEKQENVRKN